MLEEMLVISADEYDYDPGDELYEYEEKGDTACRFNGAELGRGGTGMGMSRISIE